ncbi:MAG: hypothetical protein KGL39_15430 [Patescibacteria group bacterium]|nr:hypothetical protein [Patescibacteria group bacterium]
MAIGSVTADMWLELMRRYDPIKFTQTRLFDGLRRPKFRKMREVHCQRARKLRKRGEAVFFLRWQNGHAVYQWGGPTPDVFRWRDCKRRDHPPAETIARVDYRLHYASSETVREDK